MRDRAGKAEQDMGGSLESLDSHTAPSSGAALPERKLYVDLLGSSEEHRELFPDDPWGEASPGSQ